jgi:hypothetical protein
VSLAVGPCKGNVSVALGWGHVHRGPALLPSSTDVCAYWRWSLACMHEMTKKGEWMSVIQRLGALLEQGGHGAQPQRTKLLSGRDERWRAPRSPKAGTK